MPNINIPGAKTNQNFVLRNNNNDIKKISLVSARNQLKLPFKERLTPKFRIKRRVSYPKHNTSKRVHRRSLTINQDLQSTTKSSQTIVKFETMNALHSPEKIRNQQNSFLAKYKSIKLLGQGSNSSVYLCKAISSNKQFAVKKVTKKKLKKGNQLLNFKVSEIVYI